MAFQEIRHFLKIGEKGQGMTEYIIMVALIAIAAIGIYTLFGEQIRQLTGGISEQLGGDTAAQSDSVDVDTQKTKTIKLDDFQNE